MFTNHVLMVHTEGALFSRELHPQGSSKNNICLARALELMTALVSICVFLLCPKTETTALNEGMHTGPVIW